LIICGCSKKESPESARRYLSLEKTYYQAVKKTTTTYYLKRNQYTMIIRDSEIPKSNVIDDSPQPETNPSEELIRLKMKNEAKKRAELSSATKEMLRLYERAASTLLDTTKAKYIEAVDKIKNDLPKDLQERHEAMLRLDTFFQDMKGIPMPDADMAAQAKLAPVWEKFNKALSDLTISDTLCQKYGIDSSRKLTLDQDLNASFAMGFELLQRQIIENIKKQGRLILTPDEDQKKNPD
jgi:hypothetical protein